MHHFGFMRIAAASPELRVADPQHNVERMLDQLALAQDRGVELIVFPECGITGYTCHDLFHHSHLLERAESALVQLLADSAGLFPGVIVAGLPVNHDGMIFNCAVVISQGKLLGVVPKSYLPNYKEFYDGRYFSPASNAVHHEITLAGQKVPFGTEMLFAAENDPSLIIGVEICEDLWMPIPPSSMQAIAGATVLVNLSASNETIGKAAYRRQLVVGQSGRCNAAYVYASSGPSESTTDLVFGGHCILAENGTLLAESPRFQPGSHITGIDVDLERIQRDRTMATTFNSLRSNPYLMKSYLRIPFTRNVSNDVPKELIRHVEAHPFVPNESHELAERCEEIFSTQVCGLAKRLEHINKPPVAIGVSGGLDSTLALLVLCKTFDRLGEPHSKIKALTMPGFGTTERTLLNARGLMAALGTSVKEIDIRAMCFAEMQALGHKPFGVSIESHTMESFLAALQRLPAVNDLTFENIQARVRTGMLMNTGFMIGTGDLSELALGWCTYNADHMSMYNVNVSVPKTLVKFLVRWAAENEFEGETRKTLIDIVETEISPELLPATAEGRKPQSTESVVGPYELVDFFLYHFLRWGCSPEKILYLARHAKFDKEYTPGEIQRWLRVFISRFFSNQFKRSCLPDGPKVGSVSVSPRGDWRMPSDASARAWMEGI